MSRGRWRPVWLVSGVIALLGAGFPNPADAHGPIAPIASSYLARVTAVPAGLGAKVVDGDQRMWLRVPPSETVVVLDYAGAPYLRFSSSGVDVNDNSTMYYSNQTPAQAPPAGLGRATPARWSHLSGGHEYEWHDGRLHALATVALAPGATYAGRWVIPMQVNGHASALAGGLWHAPDPPLVWFWPIVVLVVSVLAARRLRRSDLDVLLARALAVTALVATAVGGIGRELRGRPTVSVGQMILLAAILAFVAWGLQRVARRRAGYFGYFVISFVALWVGGVLVSTLLDGFTLTAVPGFVARAATVTCLGSGIGLALLAFRIAERPQKASAGKRGGPAHREGEDPSRLQSHV